MGKIAWTTWYICLDIQSKQNWFNCTHSILGFPFLGRMWCCLRIRPNKVSRKQHNVCLLYYSLSLGNVENIAYLRFRCHNYVQLSHFHWKKQGNFLSNAGSLLALTPQNEEKRMQIKYVIAALLVLFYLATGNDGACSFITQTCCLVNIQINIYALCRSYFFSVYRNPLN